MQGFMRGDMDGTRLDWLVGWLAGMANGNLLPDNFIILWSMTTSAREERQRRDVERVILFQVGCSVVCSNLCFQSEW